MESPNTVFTAAADNVNFTKPDGEVFNTQTCVVDRHDFTQHPDIRDKSDAELDEMAKPRNIEATPDLLEPSPDYDDHLSDFFLQFLYKVRTQLFFFS